MATAILLSVRLTLSVVLATHKEGSSMHFTGALTVSHQAVTATTTLAEITSMLDAATSTKRSWERRARVRVVVV